MSPQSERSVPDDGLPDVQPTDRAVRRLPDVTAPSMRSDAGRTTASGEHAKGTLVKSVVVGLRALHGEEGRAPAALEARLSKEAFALLDEETIGVRWYPIAPYCELVDLFWELAGHRDPAFMREAGRAGARLLIDSGIYRSYVETSRRPTGEAVERAIRGARIAVGLTYMLYDFVEVEVDHDADHDLLVLTYRNVSSFSEALFLGTQGFLDAFAAELRMLGDDVGPDEVRWRAERPSRDRFVLSLSLDRLRS